MVKENTLLYEMLSDWSTEQLDERLAQELHKECVDEETVRTMLAVLQEREKDEPLVITPQIQSAWEKYQKESASLPKVKPKRIPSGLLRAASVGIVLILLFSLIPTSAQADNFWERVARWTNEVFEFFSPHTKDAVQEPYVFKTDNPGLQEVYDAVVAMGVTQPAVPMWVPDGYKLEKCIMYNEPEYDYVHAGLSDGNSEIIIEIRQYDNLKSGQYEKDKGEVEVLEIQGTIFHIMRNIDGWLAVWTKDSVEGCIIVDCQENIQYNILKSIYILEEDE